MSSQQQLPPHLTPREPMKPILRGHAVRAGLCVRCKSKHRRRDAFGARASLCESCASEESRHS